MEKAPFEIVPDSVSDNDLKDEVLRRSAKAGYTTRLGEAPYRTKVMSAPSTEQYRKNYDQIKWSK